MATPFPFPVTAAQVGTFFVGQYYQVLQQQPELVHQFYSDSSTAVRINGNARETAAAMLIKDLSGRRKFVQTFFLAPQENGYFVLNDILHFINEDQIQHHPTVLLPQNVLDSGLNASTKLLEPESKYLVANKIQAREFVVPADAKENGQINDHSFSDQRVVCSLEPENVTENKSTEEANGSIQTISVPQEHSSASMEETIGEPQKHTYASILRVAKGQSGPPGASPQPHIDQNGHPASELNHSSPNADQQPVVLSKGLESSQMETGEQDSAIENGGEIKSVFVRNLPPTVLESEIEEEFRKFGEIKPDGVAVRSRKEAGVCYAFVEFEGLCGVHNAIKAGNALVGGRQVFIEERRPNSNILIQGGRGRGRGSDPRGRFVFKSFGRGHGNARGERNYNRRNKTNGLYRPVVREERGFSNEEASSEVVQNLSE